MINDIMRQLLFSFRLVFFMRVLGLSAANAGWLIFEKKLVHAVTSPIIALLVDRINIPFLSQRLGRRKSWHLVGAVMGIIFTPLLFSSCFPCQSDGGQWQMMIYLGILHTILAVAATLMDIGHLSLIPAIAKNQSEAVELSAWRYDLFAFAHSYDFSREFGWIKKIKTFWYEGNSITCLLCISKFDYLMLASWPHNFP